GDVAECLIALTRDGKPAFEPLLGVTEGGRGLEHAEHGHPVTADRPQRVERVRQRAALPADEPGPARDLLRCARAGRAGLVPPATAGVEEAVAGTAAEGTAGHGIQDSRELTRQRIAVLGPGVFGDPAGGGARAAEPGQRQAEE